MEPCGTPQQNYCKRHLSLFFVSFYQSKMLRSIKNLYLRRLVCIMHLVFRLKTADQYNQKP